MRLLIIKSSALGDVVQALEMLTLLSPLLESYALKHPRNKVEIEWVVEKDAASLVALHPLVSFVHVIESKKWRHSLFQRSSRKEIVQFVQSLRSESFDVAIDLQGNCKSALIMRLAKTQKRAGLSRSACSEWPASLALDLSLDPDLTYGARGVYLQLLLEAFKLGGIDLTDSSHSNQKWESVAKALPSLLKEFSRLPTLDWRFDQPVIDAAQKIKERGEYGLFAIGSRWPNKQIPALLARSAIQQLLEQRHHERIYLVWGSEEERVAAEQLLQTVHHPRVELLPKGSLLLLARLVQQASWLVSSDSLALHLASWMSTPTFGVFGPSWGPYYAPSLCEPSKVKHGKSEHAHWQGSCPYGVTFVKRCDRLRSCPTAACLREISAEPMLQVLSTWIQTLE